jgi:hypothetical protein
VPHPVDADGDGQDQCVVLPGGDLDSARSAAITQSSHRYYAIAFALSASNSPWVIAPLSRSRLAFSISAAAPSPPFVATERT